MSVLPRWIAWVLGVVVGACALGVILVLALGHSGGGDSGSPSPAPGSASLTAYTAAIAGPTKEGGRIVEQEMKPSLGDFVRGSVNGPTFAERARGWEIALARVRQQLDQIPVPPQIPSARQLFDVAMDDYVHAAALFEQAGNAPATSRQAAIQTAVDAARAADNAFDIAAEEVQRKLRAAGLPPDTSLPDVTPAATPG